MHRLLMFVLAVSLAAGASAQTPTGTLKKIVDARTIALGYRVVAAPFSFVGPDGVPTGYTVELCKRVVAGLEQQLKLPALKIHWVPVTSDDRIAKVKLGEIDLECGTTTATFGRMEQVDFSSLTFIDGATFLSLVDGPPRLAGLEGRTVGVLAGSTSEMRLAALLKERLISAKIVRVEDETDAVQKLVDKRIDAFANERLTLIGRVLLAQPDGAKFALAEEDFSIEPYALMMRRDPDFRLAVNRALARIYSGPALEELYNAWFAKFGKPSPVLASMYLLQIYGE
ncbi:MAG: amino acid ABC transporter substrate-binding protein [Burkholderiaceae bacterium]|nr:amino acid ABC transporter substrate-binding protein [Burkholderiaceae bacterium]